MRKGGRVGTAPHSVLTGTSFELPLRIMRMDISISSPKSDDSLERLQHILHLVENALRLSDLAGYTFVAIDLSSAHDKLMTISRAQPLNDP
jgi:hypothetical protein